MTFNFGKNIFPEPSPKAIATYDFVDITNGVGYITFYGGRVSSGAKQLFKLSPNLFYSDEISSGAFLTHAGADTAYYTQFNLNFDSKFTQTAIIGGAALAFIPIALSGSGGASQIKTLAIASIIKVSADGTTTTLANETSGAILQGAEGKIYKVDAIPLDIPITTFSKDDVLRLNVKSQLQVNGSFTGHAFIAYDPQNRSGVSGSQFLRWTEDNDPAQVSQLSLQVPFRIDI